MHLNIIIAFCMIMATTAIHAVGMLLALQVLQRHEAMLSTYPRLARVYRISELVILMFIASLLETLVWAITYLALNAIEGLERALYFSMVTYTTLGYGDVVLVERWRLLSSFEAANGIIMFGWTTAIVITAVQRIYFGKELKSSHKTKSK